MNKTFGIIAGLGVVGIVIFFLFFGTEKFDIPVPTSLNNPTNAAAGSNHSPAKATNAVPEILKNTPPAFVEPTNPTPTISSARKFVPAIPTEPEFTNLPPTTVMENVRSVFRSYQSMFRENPVGTNPEITKALNGGNRKQVRFVNEEDGMRINANGELIDNWGTPYFFHQLSGTEMEIHSAGPDRVMWTEDDLVIR